MIGSGSLFKDVEFFDSIEVGAFVVGVQNLHVFLCVAVLPRVAHIWKFGGWRALLCFGVASCLSYVRFTAVQP
jgi:hypothetical protein